MKKCCMCKQDKDITEFKSNIRSKDGLQSQCISCHRDYRRQHYLNNRDKYIKKADAWTKNKSVELKAIKANTGCSKCNESEPCCLEYHHLDETTKVFDISFGYSRYGSETVQKEIEKCVLLCANCHRKVHAGRLKL